MAIFGKKTEDNKEDVAKKTTSTKTTKKTAKPSDVQVDKNESMKELYTEETKTSVKKNDIKKSTEHGNAYRVLIKPLVTEKGTNLSAENKYLFEVSNDANKISVAGAIEEVYGVKPTNVNIVNIQGKRVRFGRSFGRRKDWKKAIITLPEGASINVYEGV